MTENLISFITSGLGGKIGNELICFVISLFPVLELRGGLIAASPAFLDVPMARAVPFCIVGNLIPIPFVLLLIRRVLTLMEKWRFTSRMAVWLRQKADKNKGQIEKYGFWGLVMFVGIPLPGTGAWTGSLVAALLNMRPAKAFLACVLGVCLAACIMCLLSYGVLGSLFG